MDEMITNEERDLRWAHVKEMLGVTDLPYQPVEMGVTERWNKPTKLRVTFERELTPYEHEQYRRIMTGRSWPVPEDVDD